MRGLVSHANALDAATWEGMGLGGVAMAPGDAVVFRSGWVGQGRTLTQVGDAADDAGVVPLWLARPRAEFLAFAERAAAWCGARQARPILWPKATDVISDAPGLLSFVRGAPAWGFLLDPHELLTPGMHATLEEHVERWCSALATHPACLGIVVDGAQDPLAQRIRAAVQKHHGESGATAGLVER